MSNHILNKTALTEGFHPGSQTPVDDRLLFSTLADLQDLGVSNVNAYKYYEGLRVWVIDAMQEYVWMEETTTKGALATVFTYPTNTISNGVDYSSRPFNFISTGYTQSGAFLPTSGGIMTGLITGGGVGRNEINLLQSTYFGMSSDGGAYAESYIQGANTSMQVGFDLTWLEFNNDGTADLIAASGFDVIGQVSSVIQNTLMPTESTQNINFNLGNSVVLDLGLGTADVNLTLSNPRPGASYYIKIIQGESYRDVIFPSTVKFAGQTAPYTLDVTEANNATDSVTMFWDGSEYTANFVQNHG